jgi:hypothetical protein
MCPAKKIVMYKIKATIKIVGINPYVSLPEDVLNGLFEKNRKASGPVPVKGTLQGKSYTQTLVKYRGEWRLYINTTMLKDSPQHVGETIELSIQYDSRDRSINPPAQLVSALKKNAVAKKKFETLAPSLKKEISRYISLLKTKESIDRNVNRAIEFLLGKNSFIGRKPLK